jgi:hypothetical protein
MRAAIERCTWARTRTRAFPCWRAQASVVAACTRRYRGWSWVFFERAKRRHAYGGVFGGGGQVVHELVPVAVGVEYERDEMGAFFLGKECLFSSS